MSQETTITSTNNYPRLKIEEIIIGPRHRQDLGDIAALAKSIRDIGLLHPIVVTPDKMLIAGRRRFEAMKELDYEEVPVHVVQRLDDALLSLRAERDENECRKQFTPSEAVAIGKALEELEKPKAATRKKEGAKKGGQANGAKKRAEPNEGPGKFPGPSPETTNGPATSEPATSEAKTPSPERRVRDKVAEAVGMSGRNYEKAKVVVDAAEENPEQYGAAKAEMDKTGKVDPAFEKVRQLHTKDEVIKSWNQQPGETGTEWHNRLVRVVEKDKKGRKKAYEKIERKAYELKRKEEKLAQKRAQFDLHKEEESLFRSLCYRRDQWPEVSRPKFISVLTRCVSRISKGEEPAPPSTTAKEESQQQRE
jgi:ParB-like chromosome segregation protein Spo0J